MSAGAVATTPPFLTPWPAVQIGLKGAFLDSTSFGQPLPTGFQAFLLDRVRTAIEPQLLGTQVNISSLATGSMQSGVEVQRGKVLHLNFRQSPLSPSAIQEVTRKALVAARRAAIPHGMGTGVEAVHLLVTGSTMGNVTIGRDFADAFEGSGIARLTVEQGAQIHEWTTFSHDYPIVVEPRKAAGHREELGERLWAHIKSVAAERAIGTTRFQIILEGLDACANSPEFSYILWDTMGPLVRGNLAAAHLRHRGETMQLFSSPAMVGSVLVGIVVALPLLFVGPVAYGVAAPMIGAGIKFGIYDRIQYSSLATATQLAPLKGRVDISVAHRETAADTPTPLFRIAGLLDATELRDALSITLNADIQKNGAFDVFLAEWRKATFGNKALQPVPR